jgi:hypothetical protein
MSERQVKYWFDTEFIEDGKTIELISIGIVCEDGREFYAINKDCDLDKANDWVKTNVIPQLGLIDNFRIEPHSSNKVPVWQSREEIKQNILKFCKPEIGKPEFWAYYGDYDWVVFCQIFGTMMDLPEHFPMYCKDITHLFDDLGNPKLPQGQGEHHALADAQWNRDVWYKLEHLRMRLGAFTYKDLANPDL